MSVVFFAGAVAGVALVVGVVVFVVPVVAVVVVLAFGAAAVGVIVGVAIVVAVAALVFFTLSSLSPSHCACLSHTGSVLVLVYKNCLLISQLPRLLLAASQLSDY